MATFAALEIGRRALLANSFGLDITSNNIANSDTEGYSRRQAISAEAAPYKKNTNYIGTGVDIQSIRSFREEYLDREIRKTNSLESAYINDVEVFNAIEIILKEPSDNNLGEVINNLLNSFDELALQPESIGLREILLHNSQTLVERFNSVDAELKSMRQQAYDNLNQDATLINQLTDQIAGYNKALAITKDKNSNESLTYVDKRETAIESLAKLGNITVTYDPNGAANVFMNGINLVSQDTAHSVKIFEEVDSNTGESTLKLMHYDEKKDLFIDIAPTSGTVGSNLKHYNITLDNLDSSTGYSITKEIDAYIGTFAKKVNDILSTGYGLNDLNITAPAGRVLFSSETGVITAATIKLSNSIQNPADIPLSATAGTSGNSDIARELSRLSQDSQFLNGQTPDEFYSNFIGKVSNMAKDSLSGKNAMNLVRIQLGTQRDSAMGVNTDEEAINLIKYQKNFEAASRVVNMTSELLSTVINLGR